MADESDIVSRPLLIVSNRLPIVVKEEEDGTWNIRTGSGGLVTAMKPVLQRHGGCWIGWPGDAHGAPIDEMLGSVGDEMGCKFSGVPLSEELIEGYYFGFSNETLWPLFHDLLGHASFDQEKWVFYMDANRRFAESITEEARPDHLIWVHDYQLILVGKYLRELNLGNVLAYFLHIPFPTLDIFARLPWRVEVIRALLAYDTVGFQTGRDLRNFVECVRAFVPESTAEFEGELAYIQLGERRICAGAFPISIDFDYFNDKVQDKESQDSAWYIHENHGANTFCLGIDRLDYTKGIPAKFHAFSRALEKYPDLHGKLSLVQLVIPSRQDIPEYKRWKDRLDRLVGEINGRFARHGWVPVHYMYRSLPQYELMGYYRAAEICLVTPLKDGMNLVAKEYCACSYDDHGALILSEFAGSASQLKDHALIVNPHDLEGVADAIYRASMMPVEERHERMQGLRKNVREQDIFWWVNSFLGAVPKSSTPIVASALATELPDDE